MDAHELLKVRLIVKQAENLSEQITRLKEAIDVGKKTRVVKFDFSEKSIWFDSGDKERLCRACCSHLFEDLSERFREVFIAIVAERLNERIKELEELTI